MAKGPKEGSREWEAGLWKNPTFVRNTLASQVRRAAGGDAEAVRQVNEILAQFPELRSTVRQLDDLMTTAESAWGKGVAGDDPLRASAIADEVAALKAELLGSATGVVERVLASSFVVAYLANQRAALWAALKADSPGVAAARDRRLESAQRRLHAAAKAWALVAGRHAPAGRKKPGVNPVAG